MHYSGFSMLNCSITNLGYDSCQSSNICLKNKSLNIFFAHNFKFLRNLSLSPFNSDFEFTPIIGKQIQIYNYSKFSSTVLSPGPPKKTMWDSMKYVLSPLAEKSNKLILIDPYQTFVDPGISSFMGVKRLEEIDQPECYDDFYVNPQPSKATILSLRNLMINKLWEQNTSEILYFESNSAKISNIDKVLETISVHCQEITKSKCSFSTIKYEQWRTYLPSFGSYLKNAKFAIGIHNDAFVHSIAMKNGTFIDVMPFGFNEGKWISEASSMSGISVINYFTNNSIPSDCENENCLIGNFYVNIQLLKKMLIKSHQCCSFVSNDSENSIQYQCHSS